MKSKSFNLKKLRRNLILFTPASVLVVLFQNCSSNGFSSASLSANNSSSSGQGTSSQQCTNPSTQQLMNAGSLYYSFSAATGSTQAACDADKITSTCDGTTGKFLPTPTSNTTCLVAGVSGNLPAPTSVQIVLQGQDQQGQSNYSSALNAIMPSSQNHLTIAWKSVSGASSYNIYRSVNQGAYTLYAHVTASAATTAYNSYVSNSGSYDHQTSVDSAYQDTAATNCVSTPTTAIISYQAPSFSTSNGYTYKVAAVSAAGEGTMSTDSIAVYFAGGNKIMNAGVFNGTIVYNDTTAPVASPLGNTTNAKWTAVAWNPTDGGNAFINPYAGNGAVGWNLNIKGFNYLVLNVLAAQSGSSFGLGPEIEGDSQVLNSSLYSTSYGTLVPNQWVTLKIPLSDLMIYNYTGTNSVPADIGKQFYEFYKITLGSANTGTYWVEWYFSVN